MIVKMRVISGYWNIWAHVRWLLLDWVQVRFSRSVDIAYLEPRERAAFDDDSLLVFYEQADQSINPKTKSHVDSSRYLFPDACSNQALDIAVPSYKMNISEPEVTLDFTLTGANNATGEFV